mmetsp:Transcript_17750/g.46327  ORF Transcript_17750/g.46327 Transcript_17750/m.46327 type:complete len:118 (-) Transcript_17750:63-416(-)|eukprot:CAMPEP_0182925646 /NCGR_PEP_ID=MMETSP0105_2-20130417/9898_1 /TAXON_ID=81532 ORGANISM="Acanthoeca-like sp., Strain 10tr" /NCGR_SAMPLE_ID=MMETSP0105_2 /ASSEMBLY_ACC=CAM_ASM_000205 /LENGTH=117 /DNA_ID=CAMNT_0025063505 /DNA_START=32 /DNA_END=385 /DNA_ORIENTATION=-
MSLKATAFFEEVKGSVTKDMVKKVKAVFQWNVTKDGATVGTWTVDLKNGGGSVFEGKPKKKANCTLTIGDDDLMSLVAGDLDPMNAFMSGKLKIGGNIMLAQKLTAIFDAAKPKAKL